MRTISEYNRTDQHDRGRHRNNAFHIEALLGLALALGATAPLSLVKTVNITPRAGRAAKRDTHAKGVIPARTASPTSISAELPAGECAVIDKGLP